MEQIYLYDKSDSAGARRGTPKRVRTALGANILKRK